MSSLDAVIQSDAVAGSDSASAPDLGPAALDAGDGPLPEPSDTSAPTDATQIVDQDAPPPVTGVRRVGSSVVLKFHGSPFSHVNHGVFWDVNATLGNFFWDAWVAYDRPDGYYVSDGYGGSHALLWGPAGGNIWNGTTTVSFSSDDAVPIGEWHHTAVGMAKDSYGTNWIWTYINGICVGKTKFVGERHGANAGGGGVLFVGGSDHSNGTFRMAMLRGFEDGENPYGANNGTAGAAFIPQRYFGAELMLGSRGVAHADFLASYMIPTWVVEDLSDGYATPGTTVPHRHPGRLGGTVVAAGPSEPLTGFPVPEFIVDDTAPFNTTKPVDPPKRTYPVPPAPTDALVYDSFSRDDQTPAFQAKPTLGSTESGTLGLLPWKSGIAGGYAPLQGGPWGILLGRAVYLERMPGVAWVDVGTPNQDVRVRRRKGGFSAGETGLAFRVKGANDHYACAFIEDSGVSCIHRETGLAAPDPQDFKVMVPPTTTWNVLRVVAVGTAFTVYVDNGPDAWTELGRFTDTSALQTATGAGLANRTSIPGSGAQSLARYDDFTVFKAQ